jgi:hypothetical protein
MAGTGGRDLPARESVECQFYRRANVKRKFHGPEAPRPAGLAEVGQAPAAKPIPCASSEATSSAENPPAPWAARPPAPRSGGGRRTSPGVREKRGAGAG